jgi:hypothetical protein
MVSGRSFELVERLSLEHPSDGCEYRHIILLHGRNISLNPAEVG